jgi:hypothetical protein
MDALKQEKLDKVWVGFVLGLFGAVLGFSVFGMYWCKVNHQEFGYFVKDVFLGTSYFQDKIVTISILIDVLMFYLFMRKNWLQLCKGILAVVILAVPVAIYLY